MLASKQGIGRQRAPSDLLLIFLFFKFGYIIAAFYLHAGRSLTYRYLLKLVVKIALLHCMWLYS
jgi:hypothetical protein